MTTASSLPQGQLLESLEPACAGHLPSAPSTVPGPEWELSEEG